MGYILKDSSPNELIQAIRDVYTGELTLSPSIARNMLHSLTEIKTGSTPQEKLTERETQVLKLIARGFPNIDIAVHLNISEGTVRSHVTRILTKLHLENRTQAALFALREGLSSLYPTAEDMET
jgi:two-component system, NarL family, response regulator LiaR